MTELSALVSVVIIDIVLAGDNAIVVGMAAAGLPARQRHRVILAGIAAATVLRILFAGVTIDADLSLSVRRDPDFDLLYRLQSDRWQCWD